MTSIRDIIKNKKEQKLYEDDDITVIKKMKKIDLTDHKIKESIDLSDDDVSELLDHESKQVNGVKINDPTRAQFFVFVTDCTLSGDLKETLSLYSPILVYRPDLFTNRDIKNLRERGIKSVWITNRTTQANSWIKHNTTLYRDECVILAVYSKRSQQRFIKQLKPNVVIRKSNLKKLAVLSIAELLEALASQGTLSLSAGLFERLFPCIYNRHIEKKE